jgi:transposase InsO family protein
LALVALSVVERRLDAVRAVLAGATVSEVAASVGVSRQSLHTWISRYLVEGVAGLADRSHRPASCPHQVCVGVEVLVAELRRKHPRWGAKRIRMELLRKPQEGVAVPSTATINRILSRQGLLASRPRKRPRDSYVRWERPGPMQLWGIDIVGGVMLVNPATGELREAKVVTGVDDHSRFCVMASVVERASSRAVCLAFAQALARFGVPEEVLTDNGKQFTDRFSRYGPTRGEVLFDKICRKNGIKHRLTAPASPNQNGKVERFHGTFRPEFLDEVEPFPSVREAQVAVDAWVAGYNVDRPHQALDDKAPVSPAERFEPVPDHERAVLELWLPPTLVSAAPHDQQQEQQQSPRLDSAAQDSTVHGAQQAPPEAGSSRAGTVSAVWSGGPVEFERVVPPSGNMIVTQRQFWMGTRRAGMTARIWADCELIHVLIGGTRIKTIRSHLSVNDLAKLVAQGAVNAGPSPLPPVEDGDAVEVERVVSRLGLVSLAGRQLLAAEILGGRAVGIRIEPATLMFYDLETRELLRTRPNPFTAEQIKGLRGVRPAGPPPRPSTEPIRVQRRASNTGVVMVCGQKVALGRAHQHRTVTILVSDTTLAIELDDQEVRVVRRTTTLPVRNIKADRPRTVPSVS